MFRTIRSLNRLMIVFVALSTIGAGCISIKKDSSGADGGLFRSPDKGDHWSKLVSLPSPRGVGSIAGVDVIEISFDPQDASAIYLGTVAHGLFYSYDGGASWQQADDIAAGRVAAVAVNPRDKCTIFAAIGNRILKSTDCNRSFQAAYTDTREGAVITSMVIDWYNPRNVWAATAKGDLVRSADEGATWSVVRRFDDAVQKIVIYSRDSRVVLVGLKTSGLYRTVDGGQSWVELRRVFDEFTGSRNFYGLAEIKTEENAFVYASKFGLLKTTDGGDHWAKIETLTPPGSTIIYSLATNSKNGREIYYATGNTIYRSVDGGATWTPKKLPTTRAGTALVVSPSDGSVIYLGGSVIKK